MVSEAGTSVQTTGIGVAATLPVLVVDSGGTQCTLSATAGCTNKKRKKGKTFLNKNAPYICFKICITTKKFPYL